MGAFRAGQCDGSRSTVGLAVRSAAAEFGDLLAGEYKRWNAVRFRGRRRAVAGLGSPYRDRAAFRHRADDRLEGACDIEHLGGGYWKRDAGFDTFGEGFKQNSK